MMGKETEVKGTEDIHKKKHRKRLVIGILCTSAGVLAALLIFVFGINRWSISITLEGYDSVMVEYGDTYEDPGADAVLRGSILCKKGWHIPVREQDNIDTSNVGEYEVTYSASKLLWKESATRNVSVEDTKAPVITLTTDPDAYTLPNHPYVEEGYTASDNLDGDVTNQVVAEEKDGVIYYTVSDSLGNTSTAQREIKYFDPEPPTLALLGNTEIHLSAGQSYKEPGWNASDNCDGDITDKVVISGGVDIYSAGTYVLTYTATDTYGNETALTRTVTVTPIRQPDTVTPGGKVIYLTFDDGPGPYTQQLLDTLAKYNVKVTFFTKNGDYNYLIASEAAAGHTVAIHTFSHNYGQIYASEDAYFADLHQMESVIAQQTGKTPTMIRFPGGSSNQVSRKYCSGIMTALTKDVTDQGYQYYDWNVSSGDAGGTTSTDTVFQNVINGVQGHNVSVVLQHDIKSFSVNAVEKIIVWGLANGYTFLPLDPSSPTMHHSVNN